MMPFYSFSRRMAGAAFLLLPAGVVLAQAPVISSVAPRAFAPTAARSGALTVTFSQPLAASAAGALKVFSAQRGGLRSAGATPATVAGNALQFTPTPYAFAAGETVQYTVTGAAGGSGAAASLPRVGQFTTAVSASAGTFGGGSDADAGANPQALAVGDLDGDGDVDFVAANAAGPGSTAGTLSVRLNNGNGTFTNAPADLTVGRSPMTVALGDMNGDGLLDIITVTHGQGYVNVLLNLGNASFVSIQTVLVGPFTRNLAVGDVDGDGDLDLVASSSVNASSGSQSIMSIVRNNGNGTFTVSQTVDIAAVSSPYLGDALLGDIDNDGDLDLLVCEPGAFPAPGTLSVSRNNGTGTFGTPVTLTPGVAPSGMALGDVDNDGDADLVMKDNYNPAVRVGFNNGSGSFSFAPAVAVGGGGIGVTLGDVDGDGDLDMVLPIFGTNAVDVLRNDGSGSFGSRQSVPAGSNPYQTAMADVDGDGDLDLLTANNGANTVSVRLNGGTGTLATTPASGRPALATYPNPAREAVTVTGAAPLAAVAVRDALGRLVLTAPADAAGTARLPLPAALPAGVYVVRAGAQALRLTVE